MWWTPVPFTEVGSFQSLTYQVVYPDGVSKNSISVDWASAYRVTVTVGELYSTEVPIQCEVVGTPKKDSMPRSRSWI